MPARPGDSALKPAVPDFEKLGLFYLGRPYDLASGRAADGLVLYDSKDLVTHAVCVGMTGSGKTGLCVDLLEEAAIDGIPVIAIDPKGDLGNLLLTFPDLAPADFRPWVSGEDAARRGRSLDEHAAAEAERWRKGLADWGQDGDRIRRLREAAGCTIYTPGSRAGVPVSVLATFVAPAPAVRNDAELLGERIETAATSLLTLAGVNAEPIRSREHVLVSNIFAESWKAGHDLDLAAIIRSIQKPPFARMGVLDLEAFYPSADRQALAMQLNQLLAAPGFEVWREGEPLDIDRLLYDGTGRPRVSIFSIAHLDDTERMFFVSLLLDQMVGWLRGQPGTTSLRAILYMDEIFGFFPPVANPPAKKPLLTLLKQSRAFGLGVVLATQNPVDLDYKGLANAGTWLIGRLQTERDRARLIDGLDSLAGSGDSGRRLTRAEIESTIGALSTRVFLMHNVHGEGPVVFETRWAMSYLRGPLTREEIRTLMAGRESADTAGRSDAAASAPSASQEDAPPPAARPADTTGGERPAAPPGAPSSPVSTAPPVLPSGVPAYFLPASDGASGPCTYEPALYGAARVRFADSKHGVDEVHEVAFVVPITHGPVAVAWDRAVEIDVAPSTLGSEPPREGRYEPVPPDATRAKSYDRWSRDFGRWLAASQRFELLYSESLGVVSRPHESERDFRVRLQRLAHEQRDRVTEKLRQNYAARAARLEDRLRRAEQAIERETDQARQQKMQTAVSFGATILGAILGRKTVSTSTLGRATTAARGLGRASKEARDIERARENAQVVREKIDALEQRVRDEIDDRAASIDPVGEALETLTLKPRRGDVTVDVVALAWRPRAGPTG